jgi:hypothetical protein
MDGSDAISRWGKGVNLWRHTVKEVAADRYSSRDQAECSGVDPLRPTTPPRVEDDPPSTGIDRLKCSDGRRAAKSEVHLMASVSGSDVGL